MTDFNPEGVVDSAPVEGSEASSTDVNWEDKYRSEVADRVKERERYKPIAQTFAKMHPDDARAVQEFANAFASGDTDTAVRWMVDNARTLATTARRNENRWTPIRGVESGSLAFTEDVNQMKEWVVARTRWLDAEMERQTGR